MSRLTLAVLSPILSLLAQDPNLELVARRLQNHPAAHRKVNAMQQRAALLAKTLDETAAALEQSDSSPADLRAAVATAAGHLDRDFASIEATLAPLNLPEKLHAWRAFASHARARLAATEAALAALPLLAPAQRAARAAELRASLTRSRPAMLPTRPMRLTSTAPAAGVEPSVPPRLADDGPTAGDLAESRIVTLSAAIRARAAALHGDPAAMYDWAARHTEPVPSIGLMQSAQAVLDSGRGNDFDQSTLLIALLRASSIPARYVSADVTMPREQVREWFGLKDDTLLLQLVGTDPDYLLFHSIQASTVTATRVWVEAYLDTPDGKRWMTLDPARKRRAFQPGIILNRPVYDRLAYLKALNPVPPSELYLEALRTAFLGEQTGHAFSEVPYTGTLLAPAPIAAELAYPVTKLHFRASEIPAANVHRVRLTLTDSAGRTTYLNLDLVLPEVILQSIDLSFIPATAADAKVVEAFGGLEATPAAVVHVLPEFRLNGRIAATGKTSIPFGTMVDLTVNHAPPVPNHPYTNTNHHYFTAGETGAIVLGAHHVSDSLLAARVSSFLARLATASSAESTRLLLDLAAVRYLHRVELSERRLSGPLQMIFYPDDEVGNAITFASLEAQNLFDRPFVVTPGRLRIHAWPTCLPYIDLNNNHHGDPISKTAWQLQGDSISALEHEIWEELILTPSVSTIKILQAAVRDNQTPRVITADNAAAEIAGLQLPQSLKATLQGRIALGATLTVPQRTVTIGAWKGTGWIEEFANWEFNYIIYDSVLFSPGGDTGGSTPPARPPQSDPGAIGSPTPANNTTCSDPVNVANGNLFEQFTDLAIAAPGPGIVFTRTYNSLALAAGPLGPGWRHSFQSTLIDSGASVTLTDPTGAVLKFQRSGDSYSPPAAYPFTLSKDAQGYLVRTKHGLRFRYDTQGRLVSITDRNGAALTLTYDAQSRPTRIDAPASRTLSLAYDGQGRLTTISDHTGRRAAYEYDSAGHLTAVTNPAGHRATYSYHSTPIFNHLLRSLSTPEGRITTFDYYGNGKVARVTLPGGQSTSFLYLPLRNETHVINARGRLTSYFYNSMGTVTRIARPDGNALDRAYNAQAQLESQSGATGAITRYIYDAAGDLITMHDSIGSTFQFRYSPDFHLLTSMEDASGFLKTFDYDERGNLTRSVNEGGFETLFTRNAQGRLTAVTNAEGHATSLGYDDTGQLVSLTDHLGNVTRLRTDLLGRVVSTTDALGAETSVEYDTLDRVTRMTRPSGRFVTFAYSPDQLLASASDAAGRTSSFAYDERSNLAQVLDALSQSARYSYSALECACSSSGQLASYADPAGFTHTQTYDDDDQLVSSTNAAGASKRLTYDPNGRLASLTSAAGATTAFEYDTQGRLTRKLSPDDDLRFAYDASNNMVAASNAHVAYAFTYDGRRRLTSVTDSRFDKTIAYSYDRLGRRATLTDPDGGVFTYSWLSGGRIGSIQNPTGASASWAYDALHRPARLAFSNGLGTALQFDPDGRVTSLQTAGSSGPPVVSLRYEYDPGGNLANLTDLAGTHALEYDPVGRLTAATHPALPAESFRYDAAGNRLASASSDYAYDNAGRLTSAEGASFEYDTDGRLIRKAAAAGGTTSLSWNGLNQLTRIDFSDGTFAAYKYDAFGRRIEKSVNGEVTAYLYDLSAILLELDASGAVRARYTHAPGIDQPLIMERGGQDYFFHTDATSNVAALTDASGAAVCSYTYDAFGRTQACTGPANPYAFSSREFDSESGLYFLRARYYDPSIGRFISPDPLDLSNLILAGPKPAAARALLPLAASALTRPRSLAALRGPQQLNAYVYALNNPASYRDPSGLNCGIHVQMGWVASQDGASADAAEQFEGNINNFNHWLQINHYSLSYVEGSYANITDADTGQVVGVVSAEAAGFTPVPYQPTPSIFSAQYWQAVGAGVLDVGQHLGQNFQASLQVPWHQLSGQQYWDAANNPQSYVSIPKP